MPVSTKRLKLTTQETHHIKLEVANRCKSATVAYLFWFFFGILGGHRYYFNKSRSAVVMSVLIFTLGGLTIGLLISIGWTLIDGVLILRWLARDHEHVRQSVTEHLLARKTWS